MRKSRKALPVSLHLFPEPSRAMLAGIPCCSAYSNIGTSVERCCQSGVPPQTENVKLRAPRRVLHVPSTSLVCWVICIYNWWQHERPS
ncbi:hypothetical protein BaRGS_00024797 [Batillaria attramentaria]|uniref:Secreted protein n=1 Tax=Batillaria attramentaria TaxID=370345 RepID=A0ABD0K9Y6_9CAEN